MLDFVFCALFGKMYVYCNRVCKQTKATAIGGTCSLQLACGFCIVGKTLFSHLVPPFALPPHDLHHPTVLLLDPSQFRDLLGIQFAHYQANLILQATERAPAQMGQR